MKRVTTCILLAFFLGACDVWGVAPQPFPALSPVPTGTPPIVTPTPLIIPPPTFNSTVTPAATSNLSTAIASEIPSATVSSTAAQPAATDTFAAIQAVAVEILGCNTSIDIRNGMGEVTNAYVIVKNTGTLDLPNACGLLRAKDEDRAHPDKKVCVPNLPAQHQVTLKLTVDSAYRKETVIQVDALSNEVVLLRVDKESCRDINLFGGVPANVGVIEPIP
ncbi:hypothetical protein FBQ83_02915 [Chloroflexi bacterium CFX5]|nr:hypothetical protein [Chloroflexi bacterium CFX5]NUQ58099.1 hypothetical protein [Anaerolineales bacterium]